MLKSTEFCSYSSLLYICSWQRIISVFSSQTSMVALHVIPFSVKKCLLSVFNSKMIQSGLTWILSLPTVISCNTTAEMLQSSWLSLFPYFMKLFICIKIRKKNDKRSSWWFYRCFSDKYLSCKSNEIFPRCSWSQCFFWLAFTWMNFVQVSIHSLISVK